MKTKDLITEKMDEKIYSANSGDSKENITEILYCFLDELVKRKRKQSNIGGLSAGLVSSKDEFAAKVNENDGKSSHFLTSINLIKYLNGDDFYITERGVGNTALYKDDLNTLFLSCIETRIMAGDRELLISFASNKGVLSEFQEDLLQAIVDSCKLLIDNDILDDVSLGFRTGKIDFRVSSWDDDQYKNICEAIEEERRRTAVHNRVYGGK